MLHEFGLKQCTTLESCDAIIDSLRMRQLDRLKMMLSRLSQEEDLFSFEIKEGIRKNDLRIFSRAIFQLNNEYLGKY